MAATCWVQLLNNLKLTRFSHLSQYDLQNRSNVHQCGLNIFKTLRLWDHWDDIDDTWHVYSMGCGTKPLGSGFWISAPAPCGATPNLTHSGEMAHPDWDAYLNLRTRSSNVIWSNILQRGQSIFKTVCGIRAVKQVCCCCSKQSAKMNNGELNRKMTAADR